MSRQSEEEDRLLAMLRTARQEEDGRIIFKITDPLFKPEEKIFVATSE